MLLSDLFFLKLRLVAVILDWRKVVYLPGRLQRGIARWTKRLSQRWQLRSLPIGIQRSQKLNIFLNVPVMPRLSVAQNGRLIHKTFLQLHVWLNG